VFNSGHWKAIQWSEIENNVASFSGMGRDILYLPAFYINEEIVAAWQPFILDKDGMTRIMRTDGIKVDISTNESTGKRVTYEGMTDESFSVPLKVGKKYALQQWTDGVWVEIATTIGSEEPMVFNELSSGGLYWLVEVGGDHEERPFTIEDSQIVRW
jgi:hypothetical protein